MMRKLFAALGLAACLAAPSAHAAGPIKSKLKKVLVYFYNYAGDHTNTPAWCGYLMKLGAAHGIQIDTSRNSSVFTAANLSNYQAVVLFNAYLIGTSMSQPQKDALHDWYGKNNGIACFHQCVKNAWSGTSPNWYDSLMGGHYIKAAGFGTGPVYVEAGLEGSDLAMNSDSSAVATGTSMKWNDEWYTYDQAPNNIPATGKQMLIWTTKKSANNQAFVLPGDVQPMAWARVTNGGRFVLNSMYHTSDIMTTTDAALKKFNDGSFLGSMRWVAGYTGCTDSKSQYYNAQATHNDPLVCSDGKFSDGTVPIRIGVNAAAGEKAIGAGRLRISFAGPDAHSLDVYDSRGRKAYSVSGRGPQEYGFAHLRPGFYVLSARSGKETFQRGFLLL